MPSSQLTTKFARDEADKVKETSSSDKTGTTPLGRKHRARILPLSVTGHTRNRVPETRDENVKTTVDCKAACIFACRSRTSEWLNKSPDTRMKMECETGERFFRAISPACDARSILRKQNRLFCSLRGQKNRLFSVSGLLLSKMG